MSKSGVIGFRLDPNSEEQLRARAEQAHVSPAEFARTLVRTALDKDDPAIIEERLDRIERELALLQANLEVAVKAILVTHGDIPLESVEKWADENLR